MFEINGVKLELNLFDVDMNESYETAYEDVGKELENANKESSASEKLRIMCGAIKGCFDTIFGIGVGDEVCGNNLDLMKCIDAYEALTDEGIRQRNELDTKIQKVSAKYQGKGAQRRK